MSAPVSEPPSADAPPQQRKPSIDTTGPAINSHPIELDSTPVSPDEVRSLAGLPAGVTRTEGGVAALGGGKAGPERAQLLDQRSKDPAVLVNIPGTPGPVDYEVAQKGVGEHVAGIAKGAPVG